MPAFDNRQQVALDLDGRFVHLDVVNGMVLLTAEEALELAQGWQRHRDLRGAIHSACIFGRYPDSQSVNADTQFMVNALFMFVRSALDRHHESAALIAQLAAMVSPDQREKVRQLMAKYAASGGSHEIAPEPIPLHRGSPEVVAADLAMLVSPEDLLAHVSGFPEAPVVDTALGPITLPPGAVGAMVQENDRPAEFVPARRSVPCFRCMGLQRVETFPHGTHRPALVIACPECSPDDDLDRLGLTD